MNKYFINCEKIDFYRIMIDREYDPIPSDQLVVDVLKKSLAELLDLCDHTDKNGNTALIDSKTQRGNSKFCELCKRHLHPDNLEILLDMNPYLEYFRR